MRGRDVVGMVERQDLMWGCGWILVLTSSAIYELVINAIVPWGKN